MVANHPMNAFIFQWPAMLALLLLVFPLLLLQAYARNRRQRLISAMGGGLSSHRRLRDCLRLAAFTFLILALARPGYAPDYESGSRTGRDVVFVLDVSQSMLASDAQPTRLEVAKQAIRDALAGFDNERVGLVVYAGSASILCPLTYDYEFVRYMLDQANPRTVDFGGTALQAAVEKAADQVFIDGRGGFQDLIVLTDGGDNGSNIDEMVGLLKEKNIDVLLIGLGDPRTGAPIRIKDSEGKETLLEEDGAPVYTKLDDEALRNLAARGQKIDYAPVETDPFDLAEIYRKYSKDSKVDAAENGMGIIVYQEATIFFLIPALILLIASEFNGMPRRPSVITATTVMMLSLTMLTKASEASFDSAFSSAVKILDQGDYEKANTLFTDIYRNASVGSANPGELAAVEFNRGLCLLKLSESQETPDQALAFAQDAQLAFLSAKRCSADLQRAGIRIELTAARISELEEEVAKKKKEDEEMNDRIQQLIDRLTALLESQTDLRTEISAKDVDRTPGRLRNDELPPLIAPDDAAKLSEDFIDKQNVILADAKGIQEIMVGIDSDLQVKIEGMPTLDTILTEPLKLMTECIANQTGAAEHLKTWTTWPQGRKMQESAEQAIEKILELLSNNSSQPSDDGEDSDEMEDYDDMEYSDDSEGSTTASMEMQGDAAAASEMQALPVPNYSAEEILQQEQGSMQFREQKRASDNAAKVEKDY